MINDVNNKSISIFESIKKINEFGAEFWYARELSKILDYKDFRNFLKVIEKAIIACKNSGVDVLDHVGEVTEMVKIGSGTIREINSFSLSRYACYLIVQNGDPSKSIIAQGQTYFAIQTRRQEMQGQFEQLPEERKRLAIRNELKNHNKQLVDAAKNAGVADSKDYAIFQNYGYMGLYGGLKAGDIHKKRGLKKSHKILDYMGSTELAANLFRATQTEEKLRKEDIKGKDKANRTHLEVGEKVRKAIAEIGGTMPEDLPTPQKSVKKIEKEEQKMVSSTSTSISNKLPNDSDNSD
ncbi:MAG: DNA damage-inducible protein D [Candidatus Cloacimonetes bacterium 4572_65]|nr:MAG: DNA damage-inducible protein D [Candidatus Cloacimonetes bacterium 4572_65]